MVHLFFREWLSELENLVFPQACAGCGEWDVALCSQCAQAFGGGWSPAVSPVPALSRVNGAGESLLPFAVWRLGVYEGVRRRVVISWKNQLSRELTARITNQLRQRGRECASVFQAAHIDKLALVPAPSRTRRKKDGLFVVGHAAHAFCAGLNDGGIEAHVSDVLSVEKKVNDRRAKAYAMGVRRPFARSVPVVLVDDVLVTGSTLSGCARALEGYGARVCCAFVLAQREKLNGPKEVKARNSR